MNSNYSCFRNKGLPNINVAAISNRFESRIGSLGTLVTRVAYVIAINSRQILSYLYQAPSNASIEQQLRALGTDLRIYTDSFSIGKALASSLYVQAYPLTPLARAILENNLKSYLLQQFDLSVNVAINATVSALYYELYLGQQSMQNVSRVYYTVCVCVCV